MKKGIILLVITIILIAVCGCTQTPTPSQSTDYHHHTSDHGRITNGCVNTDPAKNRHGI